MHESAVDRAIREAAERGVFDDLPGKGKPLPQLQGPSDENWWIRGYLRREGISTEMLLPPSVQLRKELDRLPETVAAMRDERDVRDAVRELNGRVADYLRFPSGPRVPVRRLDPDAVVAVWRAAHHPAQTAPRTAPPPEPAPRRWWRRGR